MAYLLTVQGQERGWGKRKTSLYRRGEVANETAMLENLNSGINIYVYIYKWIPYTTSLLLPPHHVQNWINNISAIYIGFWFLRKTCIPVTFNSEVIQVLTN